MDYFGLSLLIGSFIFLGLWFFSCLKEGKNPSNKKKVWSSKTTDKKIEVPMIIENPSLRSLERGNPLANTFKNLNEYSTKTSLNEKFVKGINISVGNYMDRKVFESEKKKQKAYIDLLKTISEAIETRLKIEKDAEKVRNIDKIRELERLKIEAAIAKLRAVLQDFREPSIEEKITEIKQLRRERIEDIFEEAEIIVTKLKGITEKYPPEIAEEIIELIKQRLVEERGRGL